ncbi:MAG: SDR family oxidoreductase [Alphaproteobacteria bacterium]|nr:MAG: SDR family oxidoreductase [Alphaproteobacteria bacterium]
MAENRWALVVGASRGLGLGLAAELQRRGWNVVGTVRDEAGERRLRKLADEPGGEIRVEHLDINDDAQIATLRRRLDATQFDLVFVNAGIAPQGRSDAASASREEAAAVFITNAVSPMRVAHAFLDRVRGGRGIIAFMSSGLGSVANKTDSYSELYSASKAALNSLSRSLAASLGGRRITVLAVAPGWVRTDMGGRGASLSVEESTRGIVDMLESRAGTGRHGFVDHRGREVEW